MNAPGWLSRIAVAAAAAVGLGAALLAPAPAAAHVAVGFSFGFPCCGGYYAPPPYYYYPPPPPPAYYPPPPAAYYGAPGPAAGPAQITYTNRPGFYRNGEYCKEYRTDHNVLGTACRDAHGQWRVVN